MLKVTPCSVPEKLPLMSQVTEFALAVTVPLSAMLKPSSLSVQLLKVTVVAVMEAHVSS
jgi:hypothetical protein